MEQCLPSSQDADELIVPFHASSRAI
uniref:Uncharacterized protein n=1 Tax=Solanum lycopersicum TaxID=4081 RepID=K4CF66_SOLLC